MARLRTFKYSEAFPASRRVSMKYYEQAAKLVDEGIEFYKQAIKDKEVHAPLDVKSAFIRDALVFEVGNSLISDHARSRLSAFTRNVDAQYKEYISSLRTLAKLGVSKKLRVPIRDEIKKSELYLKRRFLTEERRGAFFAFDGKTVILLNFPGHRSTQYEKALAVQLAWLLERAYSGMSGRWSGEYIEPLPSRRRMAPFFYLLACIMASVTGKSLVLRGHSGSGYNRLRSYYQKMIERNCLNDYQKILKIDRYSKILRKVPDQKRRSDKPLSSFEAAIMSEVEEWDTYSKES